MWWSKSLTAPKLSVRMDVFRQQLIGFSVARSRKPNRFARGEPRSPLVAETVLSSELMSPTRITGRPLRAGRRA